MLSFFQWTFWISLFLLFYTYLGYGIVIYAINKLFPSRRKRAQYQHDEEFPPVALIICAYNEEDIIEDKIRQSLSLQYPAGKLQVVVVSDGSTDSTHLRAQALLGANAFFLPERKGKVAAMNRIAVLRQEPILVFCDANTMLNNKAVLEICKHFKDEKTGGVAGEKKIALGDEEKAVTAGEGLYWKYESFLKKQDSDFYSVVGAAGELVAVRKSLYHPAEPDSIIEDFILSMRICDEGYRFVYEPNAYAVESGSASILEERKRKVRIAAGAFQAMARLKRVFNPFRNFRLWFSFISHRILRWTLAPVALITLFLANLYLVYAAGGVFYWLMLLAQLGFYALAAAGWLLAEKASSIKYLYVPYYFSFMNLSVFAGFARFLRGKQAVTWEKSRRLDSKPA